mgnify:CR=1 FL=1
MDLNSIGIPVSFVLLSAIGLWILIYGKGYWWIKSIFIFLTIAFSITLWASLSELSGWPTDTSVPEKVIVHWMLVKEPSKLNSKDKGFVYLWGTEIDSENKVKETKINKWTSPFIAKKHSIEPRTYRLPYSEDLHKKTVQAMKMIRAGKNIVAEGMKLGSGEGEPSQAFGKKEGKNKGKGKQGSLSQEQDFMFYELPPFKMQDKNYEN